MEMTTASTDLCVQLRDLVEPLGYKDITSLRSRFDTFKGKLLKNKDLENQVPFKSDIYVDYNTGRVVDTYVMTRTCAINFACFVDPARGVDVMQRMMTYQHSAPTMHKSVTKRILAERYGRSIDSITQTFKRNQSWIAEIEGSEQHIEERDGELWFTEQYAACIAFGGGKRAVQVKAATMVAQGDNQKLASVPQEPILRLVSSAV